MAASSPYFVQMHAPHQLEDSIEMMTEDLNVTLLDGDEMSDDPESSPFESRTSSNTMAKNAACKATLSGDVKLENSNHQDLKLLNQKISHLSSLARKKDEVAKIRKDKTTKKLVRLDNITQLKDKNIAKLNKEVSQLKEKVCKLERDNANLRKMLGADTAASERYPPKNEVNLANEDMVSDDLDCLNPDSLFKVPKPAYIEPREENIFELQNLRSRSRPSRTTNSSSTPALVGSLRREAREWRY